MKIKSVDEVEDIYMNFKQSIIVDEQISKENISKISENISFDFDHSKGLDTFSCDFDNYSVFGFIGGNNILLSCKRRIKNECIKNFEEKIL